MGAAIFAGLLLVVVIPVALVSYTVADRRGRSKYALMADRLHLKEQAAEELREELAEATQINRKLRYTLALKGDGEGVLVDDLPALRDMQQKIATLEDDLAHSNERLARRNEAMRVARVAIKEIREQMEGTSGSHELGRKGLGPSEAKFVGVRLASLEDATGEITLEHDAI